MKYMKNQMGCVENEGKKITCSMGLEWPPVEVVAYGSPEEAQKYVKAPTAQRIEVWQKVCGLLKVEGAKCLSCKYVLLDDVLANQDDRGRRGASLRVRSPSFSAPKPAPAAKR